MTGGSVTGAFADDERAVQTQIAYTLTVAIATVLATILIASMTGIVADQQDNAAAYEMNSAGERLASQIQDIDTLAADDPERLSLEAKPPGTAAGDQYTITLKDGDEPSDAYLELETTDGISTTVELRLDNTEVRDGESSVSGGSVEIVYEDGEIWLE